MIQALAAIQPSRSMLFGSSEAESDLAEVRAGISEPSRPEILVNFDFSKAVAVNGSYLRATLLWAMVCGQADVGGVTLSASQPFAIRPYPLFPIVTGCSDAIKIEIAEFLVPRNLVVLSADVVTSVDINKAALIGHIDKFLGETLSLLCRLGGATAQQLASSSGERITINAWSNRLLDLYRLRLVHREREGKFWIYKPVAKECEIWA